MMKIQSSRLLAMAVAVAGVFGMAGNVFATNGYFAIGYGGGSEGMGGVGVTSPQDSMCVGGNPACLGEFDRPQFDMGAGLFDARRRSGVSGGYFNGGNGWSGVNTFIIPGMGFVFPFNDELTIGFAAIGNGGMDTTFKPNFFDVVATPDVHPTEYLGVNMMQLFVPITVAYKYAKGQTAAVSIVPARARFHAQGLQTFADMGFSSDRDHMTNKGNDYSNGMGVRLGWLGNFLDNKVQFGVTWASKVYMHKFNLYRGLFAGNGSFDVPENYAIGASIKPVENLTVALDVQKILYSDIPAVGNTGPTVLNAGEAFNNTPLGLPSGMGFGWSDMTVYKLGLAYKNVFPSVFGEDRLTLRAGYNYGKNPVPDKQLLFNLLAPGIVEEHYTLGATYNLGEQSILGFGSEGALTVAYVHVPSKKQRVETIYMAEQDGSVKTIGTVEAEMYQKQLTIAYTLKF